MSDSISSTSGNQPVQGKKTEVKTKKHSLNDWAKSIFAKEFSQIDKNGNGIDSVAEAKAFQKWYGNMRNIAAKYLEKVIIPAGNSIQDFTDKVVTVWSQLGGKHYTKATQVIEEDERKKAASESKQSQNETAKKRARSNKSSEPTESDNSRKTTYQQARELYEEVQKRTDGKSPEEVAFEIQANHDPLGRPTAEQAQAHGKAMQTALNKSRAEWEQIVKDVQGD